MKTCKITALKNNNRMSTQELLQLINEKVKGGTYDFEIEACGQHDLGGALWAPNNKKLNFKITNPGQRVGAMALNNTKITVIGSACADVGWLNSGATITVLGDAGDTAAHCAAGGKIYVDGCVGTRSGALMKHDPKFEQPELWVLKNTGSFSFEFMGGGIAVICGYNCDDLKSVLGNRSCVGMVGGTIYVRGNIEGLSDCVQITELDKKDEEFLSSGLKEFLKEINKKDIISNLCKFSQWKKIIPISNVEKQEKLSISEFRKKYWFKNGLFDDMIDDDSKVYTLADVSESRLRIPNWDEKKCIGCNLCIKNCPYGAISETNKKYTSDNNKCIGCGYCSAVCPKQAWNMSDLI